MMLVFTFVCAYEPWVLEASCTGSERILRLAGQQLEHCGMVGSALRMKRKQFRPNTISIFSG